jgi:hypothetical protein
MEPEVKKVKLGFCLVTLASALLLAPVTKAAGYPAPGGLGAVDLTGLGSGGRDIALTAGTSRVTNVTDEAVAARDDAARVQAIIDPWCGQVPVTVREGSGGEAGFTKSWHPLFARGGDVTEHLKIGLSWPPDHPATRAVALHECAHILQYRAYDYDWSTLDSAMRRVYPDGPHSPVEHMADCMSEVMGAERRGRSEDGQWYDAGYGGGCTPEQYDAAARVIDGQRL